MVKEVPYDIIMEKDGLEVRKYPPIVLAKVSGSLDNGAFSILFNYIQGANRSRRKVPMTAPVISSEKVPMTAPVISAPGYFSFVLPHDMRPEDIPVPTDPRVRLERVPGRTLAVMRFRGHTSPEKVRVRYDDLLERVRRNGMRTSGSPFLMRYNPPIVPGPFRRNEAAVEISVPR